jgi:hypothetical protein
MEDKKQKASEAAGPYFQTATLQDEFFLVEFDGIFDADDPGKSSPEKNPMARVCWTTWAARARESYRDPPEIGDRLGPELRNQFCWAIPPATKPTMENTGASKWTATSLP